MTTPFRMGWDNSLPSWTAYCLLKKKSRFYSILFIRLDKYSRQRKKEGWTPWDTSIIIYSQTKLSFTKRGFTDNPAGFVGDDAAASIDVFKLFCRNQGLSNQNDPLGDAFYGVYLSTEMETEPVRISIFNTHCVFQSASMFIELDLYLIETGQTATEIFSGFITIEIRHEFDSDGDGTFDTSILFMKGVGMTYMHPGGHHPPIAHKGGWYVHQQILTRWRSFGIAFCFAETW